MQAVAKQALGKRDRKPFRPHVTVAREARSCPSDIDEPLAFGEMVVDRVEVFESRAHEYVSLGTVHLSSAAGQVSGAGVSALDADDLPAAENLLNPETIWGTAKTRRTHTGRRKERTDSLREVYPADVVSASGEDELFLGTAQLERLENVNQEQ